MPAGTAPLGLRQPVGCSEQAALRAAVRGTLREGIETPLLLCAAVSLMPGSFLWSQHHFTAAFGQLSSFDLVLLLFTFFSLFSLILEEYNVTPH